MTRPVGRPRRSVALALVVAVVSTVAFSALATGAGAADNSSLQMRRVDTTDPSRSSIQFIYTGAREDLSGAQLTVDGDVVSASPPRQLPDTTKTAVAMVFDTSSYMDSSGALVAAKDAAKKWVRGRSAEARDNQLVGIVTASNKGVVQQTLTLDEERILNAIDRVAPPTDAKSVGQTALWSAIRQAAGLLTQRSDFQPNIVVMTSNSDNISGGEEAAARGAVAGAQASVFVAGLTGKGLATGPLESLVRDNGGLLLTTGDGAQFGQLVDSISTTVNDQQFETVYSSPVGAGTAGKPSPVADLAYTVGGQTAKAAVVVGSVVQGQQNLNPVVTGSAGGIGILQGPLGLALVVLFVLLAVGGIAYGIMLLFSREDRLSAVLQPYSDSYTREEEEEEEASQGLARTAIVQRAVEITEQVAESRGMLVRSESALERANLPLRAGEALFFYAALVVIVTILGFAVTGGIIGGLVAGLFAALIPVALVNLLASRRKKQFMAQLPDTLQLLSGTLRAGYSLMQGVEAVSQEVTEPMGLELRRVVTESRLGRPLEDALDGTAERMDSPDFAWAVMAIRIQREVGGNLSELLLTVAETMTARERLRRDVASLTAEGRMSAIILGILPIGIGLAMYVINPEYISQLFKTTLGNILLGVALVAMGIGFFWMKKIIDIEI